jgi:DNA polymerase-1
LRAFFEARHAKTLYHRAWYDVYILVYQLFMEDVLDTEGMLYGIEVMLRNFEDTQLIRYLATNSCAGNKLSLKDVAQEFAGNYAVEVNNIAMVPLNVLLTYNLVDGLSTWYAYNKHWPTVVADAQQDIYENLFKPSMYDIIQMQLTGLPIDMDAVEAGTAVMEADRQAAVDIIMASPFVTRSWVFRFWKKPIPDSRPLAWMPSRP